jgi:hypothetical protein
MGWTWGTQPDIALAAQPALANIAVLVERWPGLKEAIERRRKEGLLPPEQPSKNQEPPKR